MCQKPKLPVTDATAGAAVLRHATVIRIEPSPRVAAAEPFDVAGAAALPQAAGPHREWPDLPGQAEPAEPPEPSEVPSRGSRRRRLWELDTHAHCPVVGVCLPMRSLRKLVEKHLHGPANGDDYELHSGAVMECKQRTRVAELLQRELDERYAVAVRLAARAKTTEALAELWREAMAGGDIAGALWATLTHPRCDASLSEHVLHEVHMLQHQVGAAHRADARRLAELTAENTALARELAAAQQRSAQAGAEQGRRIEQQQAQLVRLRAELLGRDTLMASLREELMALEAAVPALRARTELARQVQRQQERIQELERSVAQGQQDAQREARRADAALQALHALQEAQARAGAEPPAEPLPEPVPLLGERAILCVGGRAASVPVYRQTIEREGGRFLHHDGGGEDNVSMLDASLAAADLVICQTGCISHDAYWRVKNHCKRTGKRCVFVENPSGASLQRALQTLNEPAPSTRAAGPERRLHSVGEGQA
jgi:hypothetical protein